MATPARPPDRALILHFTHIANMPSIVARGALLADSAAQAAGLPMDVGDIDVKARRRSVPVGCGPGGMVSDYVPFYFAARSPMMFRIACDHRDSVAGRYGEGEDPLVYIVSSVDRVVEAGLDWVASDGNCAAALTRFVTDVHDLETAIDWPLMRESM
jgi:hypothetical protein